jgi:hypothetical protein
MTELIALLSTGKGTWSEVVKIIGAKQWNSVFLVTNDFGKKFKMERGEIVVCDFNKSVVALQKEIHQKLNGKIKGLEVALNIISGTGKEHMALLSALMKLGVGFRLVTVIDKEFIEV